MTLTKKDIIACVITGATTGIITWRVFDFLEFKNLGASWAWLIIVIPLVWLAGVELGYLLGRYVKFFNEFGRYVTIGFTNFAVDSAVLYALIFFSGVSNGYLYAVFKSISFCVAVAHSYVWNKYWAFNASAQTDDSRRMSKFFIVNVAAFVINVSVASLAVNGAGVLLHVDPKVLAGIGAIAGSAVALIFSFVGFKFLVFK